MTAMAGAARPAIATGAVLAWCSCLLAGAGLVTSVVTGPGTLLSGHVGEDFVLGVVWSALGGLLAAQVPGHRFGPLFLIVGACHSVALAASGYAMAGATAGWHMVTAAAWVSSWIWVIGMLLPLTLVLLWMPDGTVPSPRWRPIAALAIVAIATFTVAAACSDGIEVTEHHTVANPLRLPVAGALWIAGSAGALVIAAVCLGSLLRRLTRSGGDARRQFVPVACAAVCVVPALLLGIVLPRWDPLIQIVALPLLPIAVTVSVLRYRMYDVEVIVRRSLVFLGLTAVVIGGYVLIVQATAGLLRHEIRPQASLIATGAVALAFQPARTVLQRAVGRLVYGDRDATTTALVKVGGQLSAANDAGSALVAILDLLRRSLRLPYAGVVGPGQTISSGIRPAWAGDEALTRVTLTHLGTRQGQLLVARRGPREQLSRADLTALDQLAVPLAAAVASIRLIDDLRTSRERVVLAREEERRRLRRDLHDGLGPLLSAVAIHADVASLRLTRDPARAAEMVERLRQTSSDAVISLRSVVEGLRPAALDELGLIAALTELATTMTIPGECRVDVVAIPLPALPAAVELAAYRIAGEAINNAARHGRAGRIVLDVSCEHDSLRLAICDNGDGFAEGEPDADAEDGSDGVGLRSMRDRADELGGTVTVRTGPDGTTVEAELPTHIRAVPCE